VTALIEAVTAQREVRPAVIDAALVEDARGFEVSVTDSHGPQR
jgi:hypothetical protein